MVRAPASGQMRANKERNAGTRAKYSKTRQKSSLATIRNNQAIRAPHNAIVMMQMPHLQNHKQRQRDDANNASVISTIRPSRHNAIVISRFRAQVFVTKRNISSAYLSYKPGLSLTSGIRDTNTNHDHAPIRIRISIRRRYEYGTKSKNLLGGASRENRAGDLIPSWPDPRYEASRVLYASSRIHYTLPAAPIKSRLYGGFFIGKRPSHYGIISIIIEIPAFNEFSALAGGFIKEINENHGLRRGERGAWGAPCLIRQPQKPSA